LANKKGKTRARNSGRNTSGAGCLGGDRQDAERLERFRQAAEAYLADPEREKVLFVREIAPPKDTRAAQSENLYELSYETFNRQIWANRHTKLQWIAYRGRYSRWADILFMSLSLEEMRRELS